MEKMIAEMAGQLARGRKQRAQGMFSALRLLREAWKEAPDGHEITVHDLRESIDDLERSIRGFYPEGAS